MNKDQNEALCFQLQRNFAVLSRNLLSILETLKFNHQTNFDKLYDNLPECGGIIDMANYFDNDYYERYRKLILDATNSTKRDLESNLSIK